MMSQEAQLLTLQDYDPQMAALQLVHEKTLATNRVWIRGRDWQDGRRPQRKFSVAIVGTRKPSEYGVRVVEDLVRRLSAYEMCIVSGGAFGIDRLAHECALERDMSTKAWLVGPIDDPGPRTHRQLFESIERAEGSALLVPSHLNDPDSGFRTRLGALAWLTRNAWIVAEADVVVVVEAYQKSGTWQTVLDTDTLNRGLYVVPGPLFAGSSYGTNRMISNTHAQAVFDLGELTETLVVLAGQGSYNVYKGLKKQNFS